MKELIFKLAVDIDYGREDIKTAQNTPEGVAVNVLDQKEQMKALRPQLDESRKQLEIQEKKFQDGEQQMRRLQEEIAIIKLRPKPEGQEGLPSEVQAAWETRFARVEEEFRKIQRQNSQWQGDSLKDFQSIESYLTQVHTMVTELHHRTETSSSSMPNRPWATRLAAAARKGNLRVEVESPEACRVGEVVLLGEREAKMVVDKGSLVFRFPLERDHLEGTIVRPLDENEIIQAEGDRLCIYRRGQDDDICFVCHVDLLERSIPERGDPEDEAQDRAYAEDLEARIQRIMDAREATRARGCSGGGVVIPPLSSAHEWGQPTRARAVGIPVFGNGDAGDAHSECMGEAEPVPRSLGEQGHSGESSLPQYMQVKHPLNEYFCRGMDISGAAAWAKVLRDMATGDLLDVGALNAREGVREEEWTSFDLRTVKFPSTQTSSVRRAVLIQNFEADLTHAILWGLSVHQLLCMPKRL